MSALSGHHHAEKGPRYLALLDQALCNAHWTEVPELARKVDKHAPNRMCLTLTARSEAQAASASHRPASASSSPVGSIHGLSELVPRLEEAIAVGNSIEEDAFVASVCLAEIHWLREDYEAALRALPEHVPQANASSSLPSALGWMEICGVKTAYIRAAVMESQGRDGEARKLYLDAVTQTPGSRTPELRRWTERMLARACMHYYTFTSTKSIQTLSESLRAFSAWNDFWQRSPSSADASGTGMSRIDIPRRQVWRAYYDILSTILQHGLVYQLSPTHASGVFMGSSDLLPEASYTSVKTKQRADLKRVEATYESLLINETQFPKASQTNREVEEWVEQAIKNWRIICGSGWTDVELGEGGKQGASRNMLEILYRAATKTFHSTAILRELMNVHAAVGEFDLAMHAFDSYVEIVGRGKARAEKTGEHELGFDDDDTAVLTAVEAVRILCRYGDREQAEKAVEVGKNIQKWLGLQRPTSSAQTVSHSNDNRAEDARPPSQPTESMLRPTTLAAAYRAIGIGQSHWARLTYETEARSGLQSEAIKQLQRSQAQDPEDIETAYALALVLAETRDISAAISVIRRILATKPRHDETDPQSSEYSRQRRLVPLWHLLALCLSAKDQNESAMKMCEAAFEQFGDSTVLFGTSSVNGTDLEKHSPSSQSSRSVVDQMDCLEKESILQIKMSQLTFVELMEGPSVAVDMTDELLSLYARLFGNPEQVKAALKPPPTAVPISPSKPAGTLRSIAGSIKSRSARRSVDKDTVRPAANGAMLELPAANGTTDSSGGQFNGSPIAITVTNEDGVPTERGRSRHEHRHLPFRFRSSQSNGRSRSRSNVRGEKPPPDTTDAPPLPPPKDSSKSARPVSTINPPVVTAAVTSSATSDAPTTPQQPLKYMEHNNTASQWPPPAGHDDQPPTQDVRLPAPHPASSTAPPPSFPSTHQRRHKITLLVQIWLFIADLYTRAEALDDAAGAVAEALKLVEAFELEVAAEQANARAFFFKGWGLGKSVDELWADIWASKGDLCSARSLPFDAMAHYETALSYFPDHPLAIVALANYLLDIYTQALPAEAPQPLLPGLPLQANLPPSLPSNTSTPHPAPRKLREGGKQDPTPAELNRLAARDRAYMLLQTLTRLGSGWDDSEAWLGLARVRELSGELGKAKEALWWVVELEDARPVRGWGVVGGRGLVV